MVRIHKVIFDSPASVAGIVSGDLLYTVNGKEIRDVIDYRFYTTDKILNLKLSRNGAFYSAEIRKKTYADIGLEFKTYLIDKKRSCRNRCIFCFIDQLPSNLRKTLYFKDDDCRLSFLSGNYITLTNLSDADIDRIIEMKMNPINLSVHTTNPELRSKMTGNKDAAKILSQIKKFTDGAVTLNCQIVLCKSINDGSELIKTMTDLRSFFPYVASVSVVPAGLTKYRENLYPLIPFTAEECREIIDTVTIFGNECKKEVGSRIFFCGDEFYTKSHVRVPHCDFYEEFPQLENGVGMLASTESEIDYCIENFENEQSISSAERKIVSIATGTAAYPFICKQVKKILKLSPNVKVLIYEVKNEFFGGEVTVAGLLTGTDIYNFLKDKQLGETLFLPSSMLRAEKDLFLDDMKPWELSEKLGVCVRFLHADGSDFLEIIK